MRHWTKSEEQGFSEIMKAGNMERLPAIRLFRRVGGDIARALQIAKRGLSDSQIADYEKTKAARITRLAEVRKTKRLMGVVFRQKASA